MSGSSPSAGIPVALGISLSQLGTVLGYRTLSKGKLDHQVIYRNNRYGRQSEKLGMVVTRSVICRHISLDQSETRFIHISLPISTGPEEWWITTLAGFNIILSETGKRDLAVKRRNTKLAVRLNVTTNREDYSWLFEQIQAGTDCR